MQETRYTVVCSSGRKRCQYTVEAEAQSHAKHIGGSVIVAAYNPERVYTTRRGVKRVAGIRQAHTLPVCP